MDLPYDILCVKIQSYLWYPFHKKSQIRHYKNEKKIFGSCFGNLVGEYGHDSNNLAMDMSMTLVIWLKSHESLHKVVHSMRLFFFSNIAVLKVYDFFQMFPSDSIKKSPRCRFFPNVTSPIFRMCLCTVIKLEDMVNQLHVVINIKIM